MRVFGHKEMTVAARTVIERETTGMELALVLDNTGSMWGANYTAMYNAAVDLVDIIYGDESEIDNLWVSVVPYTATVNVGTGHGDWLAAGDAGKTNTGGFATRGLEGLRPGADHAARHQRHAALRRRLHVLSLPDRAEGLSRRLR